MIEKLCISFPNFLSISHHQNIDLRAQDTHRGRFIVCMRVWYYVSLWVRKKEASQTVDESVNLHHIWVGVNQQRCN